MIAERCPILLQSISAKGWEIQTKRADGDQERRRFRLSELLKRSASCSSRPASRRKRIFICAPLRCALASTLPSQDRACRGPRPGPGSLRLGRHDARLHSPRFAGARLELKSCPDTCFRGSKRVRESEWNPHLAGAEKQKPPSAKDRSP